MKKTKRGLKINVKINLTNRWLYTLIAIGILAIISVGVYAYGTSNSSTFGHSSGEIDIDIDGDGTIDKTLQEAINAGDFGEVESDPTVLASVKDGVSWSELSGIPDGFADGIDDAGDACGSGMDAVFSYLNSGEDSVGSDSTGHLLNSIKPDTCNGNTDSKYNCPASASKYCKDIFLYSGYTNYGYRYVTCKKRANVQCLEP